MRRRLALLLACRDDPAETSLVVAGPPASNPSSSRPQPQPELEKVPTESADIQAKPAQNLAAPMGMTGSEPERRADSEGIWLSYKDALKELKACAEGSFYATGWRIYDGACSDGKRFLTKDGAFGGSTRFYRGDRLVGTSGYSDMGQAPLAGDVRCEIKKRVPLCAAPKPPK
jgi:hypothetical protein